MLRPDLRTPPQAAEYLGKSPQTLALWRRRNKGPEFIFVGHEVRYRAEALAEYLARQTVRPTGHSTVLGGAA